MHRITVVILRVSTRDRQDTAMQRTALEGEIARRQLLVVPHDIYSRYKDRYQGVENVCVVLEDKGTGRNTDRPGYKWAKDQVKAGFVKAVMVYDASRLNRNLKENIDFADECIKRGTEFYSEKDKVDITSPQGKMVYGMLSTIAQFFSDRLSETIKDGIFESQQKAKKEDRPWRIGSPGDFATKEVRKNWKKFQEMLAAGMNVSHISRVLGWTKKTVRKWRDHGPNCPPSRKARQLEVYGKSASTDD